METKEELRKRLLKERNRLKDEEKRVKSALIFERLTSLEQYKKAQTILAYMDYRNEVMTHDFIRNCRNDAKRVVLPKVVPDHPDCVLDLYEISEIGQDTVPGYKGIMEPDCIRLKCLNPMEIDLAVIPGVAFDSQRHRIGYGAGYYDRFIPRLRPGCLTVGVAYSLQLVENIQAGEHDLPVDAVITEDRIIFDHNKSERTLI